LDDTVQRLGILSLHTSPLTQPGTGDSGGMNVYVRELAGSLARAGVSSRVYVRRWADVLPDVVEVEPGVSVVHIDAGPPDLAKESLPDVVEEFTDGVERDLLETGPVDALHANYWLSGVAGHRLKHSLGLPLVSTFHTLARVKAEAFDAEPERRVQAEAEVIGCSDVILANSPAEATQLQELYGAARERIEVVPPGVEHAFFSPGDRGGARAALGLGDHPVLLFVGRIQPLKGLDVAVATLAGLDDPTAVLVAVGGPSGVDGPTELGRVQALATELGVADRVRFVPPQPHHMLSTYYRAANVTIVPSRSESFGLVALESAACGTPVVAAAVGGLRTLVEHGETGFLVDERDPALYASRVDDILEDPLLAARLSAGATALAAGYTWSTTAARLRRTYADLRVRALVDCAV
jgi:D-inositol-3-phosphate glycosyltransferase